MRERLDRPAGARPRPAAVTPGAPAPARLASLIGNRAFARLAGGRRVARTVLKTAVDELDTTQSDFAARVEAIADDVARGRERIKNLRAQAEEHCSRADADDARALDLLAAIERQLVWQGVHDPRGDRKQESLKGFPDPPFAVGDVFSALPLRAYRFVSWLGDVTSTNSKVAKAVHVPSGEEVAIKVYDKEYLLPETSYVRKAKPKPAPAPSKDEESSSEEEEDEPEFDEVLLAKPEIYGMRREVRHHRQVSGTPGILPLREVIEDRFNLYVVTPLAGGGDVEQAIERRADKRLPEAEAGLIFRRMVDALAATHAKGIAHLDMKARNIVIPSSGPQDAQLMDFGGSRTVAGMTDYPYYGTEDYMAPEIKAAEDMYSRSPLSDPNLLFKADVYSLAVTMIEMLTGKATRNVPSGIDSGLASLLDSMLVRDPRHRADLAAVRAHRWWTGAPAVVQ
jgi:hypothetical protein